MQETQVRSLGHEDLEEEMATHSSVLAWEIPWTEEPDGPYYMRSQKKLDTIYQLNSGKQQKISPLVKWKYPLIS